MKIRAMKLLEENAGGLLAQFNVVFSGMLIRGFALQRVETGAIIVLSPRAVGAGGERTVKIEAPELREGLRARALAVYEVLEENGGENGGEETIYTPPAANYAGEGIGKGKGVEVKQHVSGHPDARIEDLAAGVYRTLGGAGATYQGLG